MPGVDGRYTAGVSRPEDSFVHSVPFRLRKKTDSAKLNLYHHSTVHGECQSYIIPAAGSHPVRSFNGSGVVQLWMCPVFSVTLIVMPQVSFFSQAASIALYALAILAVATSRSYWSLLLQPSASTPPLPLPSLEYPIGSERTGLSTSPQIYPVHASALVIEAKNSGASFVHSSSLIPQKK